MSRTNIPLDRRTVLKSAAVGVLGLATQTGIGTANEHSANGSETEVPLLAGQDIDVITVSFDSAPILRAKLHYLRQWRTETARVA